MRADGELVDAREHPGPSGHGLGNLSDQKLARMDEPQATTLPATTMCAGTLASMPG